MAAIDKIYCSSKDNFSEYTMKVVDKSFSDNEYNLILYNDTYKTYSPKV